MNDNHKKKNAAFVAHSRDRHSPISRNKSNAHKGVASVERDIETWRFANGVQQITTCSRCLPLARRVCPRSGAGFLSQQWLVFQRPPPGRAAPHLPIMTITRRGHKGARGARGGFVRAPSPGVVAAIEATRTGQGGDIGAEGMEGIKAMKGITAGGRDKKNSDLG